jgi:hypothetical protein
MRRGRGFSLVCFAVCCFFLASLKPTPAPREQREQQQQK